MVSKFSLDNLSVELKKDRTLTLYNLRQQKYIRVMLNCKEAARAIIRYHS